MKIAIMMRAMDQESGFQAIVETLVDNMIKQSKENYFLLLYRTLKNFGRFAHYPNVKEVLMKSNKFLWDQLSVPFIAVKEHADIIFNPKFSVPLLSPIPVTMGLHEHGFFSHPEFYEKLDVIYQRIMMPRYIKKSVHFFPISNYVLEENRRLFKIPFKNSTIIYAGPSKQFCPYYFKEDLMNFRNKYNLPEKFILTVTRVDHTGIKGSSSFYGGKKPEITFRAFLKIRDKIPHHLVFAGKRIKEYLIFTEGQKADFDRVTFTEFIPHNEIHLLYNLADIFVNAAPNEGFGMVNIQAMACGKAVILANTGGSADVGRNAALFAQADNSDDFYEKILAVLSDDQLKKSLETKSLERSKDFQFGISAKLCVETLERIVNNRKKHAVGTIS
jgi:glycosyltransferase involved in cell wall biosynthesis